MNTAISEALAAGLPVVATRHSGFPEQVIEGENGYLAVSGDPEDLAEKILFFMDYPERWDEMSEKARAHVLAHYDQQVLIGEQVHWYEKLAGMKRNDQK